MTMKGNTSCDNFKLIKISVEYTEELDRYYCILRVVDHELAKDNYSSREYKTLGLINYPIIFKTEEDAGRYLYSKVPVRKLPLYVISMLYKYNKNYSHFIVGEYVPTDE